MASIQIICRSYSKKDFGDFSNILDANFESDELDEENKVKKENDLQNKILEYIQNNKNFSISKCARDLNIDVDEIMNILSKL